MPLDGSQPTRSAHRGLERTGDAGRLGDTAAKLARLRGLLAERGAASLALTSRESLAWLLDGARITVPSGGDPVLSAVVSDDEVVLHIAQNELDRIVDEELGGVAGTAFRAHAVPWFEPLPGIRAGDGAAELSEPEVVTELRALRAPLLPRERLRYRELGADVARAVSEVLRAARPEQRETDLAADLAAALVRLGAEPVVLLVAGTERLRHRHPLPTAAALGTRAMVVVGARRHGLIANLTRWLGDEHGAGAVAERLLDVEADAFAATRPGRPIAAVFQDVVAAYARHGFAADEWLRHHQGGPTGYAGRDPRASPLTAGVVADGQAFAWNPTVPRHKVEDTVIVGGGAVEVLTVDPAWPATDVRGVLRPLPLPFG